MPCLSHCTLALLHPMVICPASTHHHHQYSHLPNAPVRDPNPMRAPRHICHMRLPHWHMRLLHCHMRLLHWHMRLLHWHMRLPHWQCHHETRLCLLRSIHPTRSLTNAYSMALPRLRRTRVSRNRHSSHRHHIRSCTREPVLGRPRRVSNDGMGPVCHELRHVRHD